MSLYHSIINLSFSIEYFNDGLNASTDLVCCTFYQKKCSILIFLNMYFQKNQVFILSRIFVEFILFHIIKSQNMKYENIQN